MNLILPVNELVKKRYSVRTYAETIIEEAKIKMMNDFIKYNCKAPFNSKLRFEIVTGNETDANTLKDLGTYGIIKGARGFVIGALKNSEKNLEDFGYLMEKIILYATEVNLGTCWLGGTFTKSNFAKKISLTAEEFIPAVVSIGYPADQPRISDSIARWVAGAKKRKPWEELFFIEDFNNELSEELAGEYTFPLEMVRLGPSASNKQPWRIVKEKEGNTFHFYLSRTKGFQRRNKNLFNLADLQRVDMGIAMSHFELASQEHKLNGDWIINDPGIGNISEEMEYIVTWKG